MYSVSIDDNMTYWHPYLLSSVLQSFSLLLAPSDQRTSKNGGGGTTLKDCCNEIFDSLAVRETDPLLMNIVIFRINSSIPIKIRLVISAWRRLANGVVR